MRLVTRKRSAGSVLIVCVVVLATLAVCVAASLQYTETINREVQRTNAMQRAVEIGDGATEMAFASWREICRQNSTTALPTSSFTTIPLPSAANLPDVTSFTASTGANQSSPATPYTIANYTVKAVDPQMNALGNGTTP